MAIDISDKANEIIRARYTRDDRKSWEEISQLVSKAISNGDNFSDMYKDHIANLYFIPAGRILRNAGFLRGSLFNCYCLPIGDSREEIGDLFKNALILWGEGGGVGINFSTLRPKGAEIRGVGGKSSGLVSFMRATNSIASTIESGGQRRAASLGLCEVWHPEIRDFIEAKTKDGDLSYFNISVGINNEFLDAVRDEKEWALSFNQQNWENINARALWKTIIKAMVLHGDPGIINMSNLQENNSYYFSPVRGTNPCGETCLEDYGSCVLGSVVLPRFVVNGRVQWSKLEETTRLAVRFLDSCIDQNNFALPQIEQASKRGRRIGVGVMGLADMLFSLKLRYGSPKAIDFCERLFKFIRNCCYEESVKLSQEFGSFPAFDSKLFCKARFVKTLSPSLRRDIRKYGIRNVSLMAMAPTGTISLIPETTSGIEPLLYKAYKRNDRVSVRNYIHPMAYSNLDSDWFVDSTDLTPEDHINMQIAVQKYTDGAVSKTILVPNDFKEDDLSGLLLESMEDLKGVTVYRDGSKNGQVIEKISLSKRYLETVEGRSTADPETVHCSTGKCEI